MCPIPRSAALVLPSALVALAACVAPHAPERPAPLALDGDHYAGSVRTGPLAPEGPVPAETQAPWVARFDARYLDRLPRAHGTAVERLARRVVVDHESAAVRPIADLARGLRVADEPPAGGTELWSEARSGVLWPGVTASFHAELARSDVSASAGWETFSVDVGRPSAAEDTVELALVLSGLVVPHQEDDGFDDDEGAPRPAPAPVPRTEHLVLDPGQVLDGTLYLLLPAATDTAPEGGFVVAIGVDRRARPDDELLAAARAEVRAAAQRARDDVGLLGRNEGFRKESRNALRALDIARLQRPALVFLSRTVDAPLLADLALAASDVELERFAQEVDAAVDAAEAGFSSTEVRSEAYQWLLERAAWSFAAARTADGVVDPPPELAGLLLRHAGEAGRYADIVLDALAESASVEELRARIVQENTIFLEDGDPAARVRAFDWLEARALAPAAYDPLGTRAARRAALAASDGSTDPESTGSGRAGEQGTQGADDDDGSQQADNDGSQRAGNDGSQRADNDGSQRAGNDGSQRAGTAGGGR